MKRIALVALSTSVLAGCSTLPEQTGSWRSNLDTAKMQAIEQAATEAGVRVYWINPPQKKEPSRKPT